jgi:hypothetical protein
MGCQKLAANAGDCATPARRKAAAISRLAEHNARRDATFANLPRASGRNSLSFGAAA